MKIGTLADRTGISVRMLRYYEEQGLLSPARRASGYRDYSAADEQVVARIRMLSEVGLKLDTIRRFLPCVRNDKPDFHPCPALTAALREEISGIEDRIAGLSASHRILSDYLDRMATD